MMFIDVRNLPTRRFDAPLLIVPNTMTTTSQKAVAYRGAIKWNLLPPEIRALPSKDAFKSYRKVNLKQLI